MQSKTSNAMIIRKEDGSFFIGINDILFDFQWPEMGSKIYNDDEGVCITLGNNYTAYDLRLMR